MKRVSKALTALLLALVMTVTLLPVQVLAAESGTEERTFTGTYVNPAYAGRIAGTVQARTAMAAVAAEPKNAETVYTSVAEAAAALRRQMTARSNSMTVALYADSDDWQAVALSVWNTALDHVAGSGNTGDYLHWQYAGVSYSASYRASGTGYQYSLTYTPNPKVASTIWYTTAAQEQQLDGHIRGTILPQLALDGKTAYQKVQAIYGWITRNVSYDHDNLYDNSYLLKYTAYAAAVNRTAVCQGYANLFYRLANDAGLDCRIITGVANGGSGAEAHAWNIVRMEDGKYYCMDATWDAGRSSYRYFLKGLDAFRTDHTAMTDEKNSTYWTKYESKVSATDYVPGSTTVVETPANVTMKSAAVSGSSIVVTWEAAANAKTYIVYRKAAGETGWSIIAKSVSGTSYTDKSVTAGIPYTYTVRGVASDGKTMSAGYDTVGKTATVPAVPANVTMKSAAVSGSSIVVTWEAAANAKTYTIYRKTKSTNWTVLVSGVSGTSYTDKSVTAGEPYTYTVRGVASDGKTMSKGYDGTGKTATVPKPDSAVPANVTMKSAAVSGSSIVVTWEAAANAKTYTIYRKTKSTNWTVLVSGVSGTSYTDKSVTAGEPYTYTVRGVASDGKTMSKGYDGTGKTATVPKPDSAVPANVTMKSAAVSGSSIVVTWEAAANAKTYTIYRKTKSTNWTVLVSGVSGTSYTDKSVTAGEPYTYTVRGVASDGKTMSKGYDGTGKTATVPKPDSAVPANVTMKSAAVSGSSIVVTWEAAANAKTYTIYRKTKSTNWTVLVSGVSGTSYTDKSVTAGEPYTYTVRGVASDGKTMSKGYDGTGKTATVPKPDSAVPANVTMKSAAVSGSSIVVTWEAAANAKTYTIYRKTKSTNWTVLVSGVSGTSYTDKSVTAGETYTYTVRGVAADGKTMSKGYDGAGKTAKVPDASTVPDPVTMVGAVADSTGITVTWKTAMGAAAYTIYRKTAGTNWTVLVSGVKGTSYVDNTALAKGTYTYTVRGVAADGRTMSPSYDRTGKTATMPETVVPANVKLGKATADAAGITVTWEAAANAKTYAIYRKTGSTSWTLLTTKASGTSYKDLTAARNQLYTYTVRGVAADGRTMSAGYDHTGVSARITASASTRPDRVKLQSAERLSDGILVTWEAAANARTYVVYRSKVVSGQASGWTAIARDVTNTYYKDIGGVSGTLYAYTVIGVAADGKTTSPSYHTYGVRATMP